MSPSPQSTNGHVTGHWDVVILGGGLAGLTLARQLLLETDASILLLDRRTELPGPNQKVGESLVQVGGYYITRTLQLEEHLLTNHFLKYNLRFYWTTPGRENTGFEDYSASFIRSLSNIPTFQLDRNVLEAHLLEINQADDRFQSILGAARLDVDLAEDGAHQVHWEGGQVTARWVVDAAGRGGALRRKQDLDKESPINHGATWCWVDGLIDIEKLTHRSAAEVRNDRRRKVLGHLPQLLATNHFCAENQWFWVIPLHGKTSLGLVYDRDAINADDISTGRKMLDYASRKWPMFAEDLANRRIVDEGRLLRYSFDCRSAISPNRWALAGEAARFSDPLYSPGSDLIAIHNCIITECVRSSDEDLEERYQLYDLFMRAMYEAYVPSYSVSYDCLGDQEAFTLKYTWELATYFGFYVIPSINDLFADPAFIRKFLRLFATLGSLNHSVQQYLSDYYQWKKKSGYVSDAPLLKEFYDVTPLRESEKLFYETGLSAEEAIDVLDRHLDRLKEFARFIAAHVSAATSGNSQLLHDRGYVENLKLRKLRFEPEAKPTLSMEKYPWRLNPLAMEEFLPPRTALESAS